MPFKAKRPIMLSVVGDSGAGKSTLARGFVETLGSERVTSICLDDYHSLDRVGRKERGITALHPDCNHLEMIGQHVRLLRQGETIFKPVYDHSDGTFGPPELVRPQPVVLIHGLHGLYTPELRANWDVSVFLDPEPELRMAWKIKRDTARRGYNRHQVLQELGARRTDSEAYIMPQRNNADIVIQFYRSDDYAETQDDTRLNVRIRIAHPIPLPDLEDAVHAEHQMNGLQPEVQIIRGVEGVDQLDFQGSISDAAVRRIENRMWDHMPNARHLRSTRLGAFAVQDGERRSNALAITQLVLTYYLVKVNALVMKQERLNQEVLVAGGVR
jgi:phosphoribulokinase